jgi:hypothetical protein
LIGLFAPSRWGGALSEGERLLQRLLFREAWDVEAIGGGVVMSGLSCVRRVP